MGILDDAIRQHLDLKRRLGADESDVRQLEDEAFGPPARPGDPEFPAKEGDTGETAAEAVAGAEPGSTEQPVVEASEGTEQQTAVADPEPEPAEPPPPEAPADTGAAPEEAAAAGPDPQVGDADSAFSTAEREAIANQPTSLYDHSSDEALGLDGLELDLDDEPDDAGSAAPDPPAGEEPLAQPTPADELEVLEETEPVSETEPPAAPPPAEPHAVEPEPAPGADEPGTGEEDVLEETPEFLRENPDDDELWFEQGEPKDFDF